MDNLVNKLDFIKTSSDACLTDWERSFMSGVLNNKKELSKKQIKIIDRIYKKMYAGEDDREYDQLGGW